MISLANLGFPSLTPLSSFNSWALSMAAWRSGEMDDESLAGEFARYQGEMAQISGVFRGEIRFQELTGELVDLLDEALLRLEACEDQTYLLSELAASGGWARVDDGQVQLLGQRLSALFETFSQLRELEEQRPRLAASPYIHEVLRCLQLFEKGVLSAELMGERLAGVSHHFQLLAEQLRLTSIRLPAVEQLLDVLEVQEVALQELAEGVAAGQRSLPNEPKRVLHDCAEQAFTIHSEIQSLSGTPAVWCDGCLGLVRETPDQTCPECGQALVPDSDPGGLLEVAERACEQNRREDWEALQPLSQEAHHQAQEMLKKLAGFPEKKPALESCLRQLAETLAEVRQCLPEHDARSLERLLPRLREDLEKAAEVQQQTFDEIKVG